MDEEGIIKTGKNLGDRIGKSAGDVLVTIIQIIHAVFGNFVKWVKFVKQFFKDFYENLCGTGLVKVYGLVGRNGNKYIQEVLRNFVKCVRF